MQSPLERKHQLLLHPIRRRREVAEWHEEVWKLSTASQRMLDEEQTLKSYLATDSVLETKMIGANVDAGSCAEVVVSHL